MNIPALATGEQALRWLRLVCEPIFKTQSVLSGFEVVRSTNKKRQAPTSECLSLFVGDPYGNRTHVFSVRGLRLNRLTNGPCCVQLVYYTIFLSFCQGVFERFFKKFLFVQIKAVLGAIFFIFYHFLLIFARGRGKIILENYQPLAKRG